MKNYTPNWFILSAVLVFIISALFVFMSFSEYYKVEILKDVSQYPFGAEGPVAGIWQYKNANNYAQYNLILGVLFLFVIFLNLLAFFNKRIIKFGILSFLLAFIIPYIIQENYFNLW